MVQITTANYKIDADPIQVNPIAVSELSQSEKPQINESEEKEYSSGKESFAELLAGLLRNTEEPSGIPMVEFIEGELNGNEFGDVQKLTLLKETPFSNEEDLLDAKTLKEDTIALLSAERFAPDMEAAAAQANEGGFFKELSDLIKADTSPAAETDAEFSGINGKNLLINNDDKAAQAQAVLSAQEALADIKKDQTLKNERKDSYINDKSGIPAEKNEQAEGAAPRIRADNDKLREPDDMRLDHRNASRSRRGRLSIEVTDMRTNTSEIQSSQNRSFSAVEAGVTRTGGETSVREVTLELRLPEQNQALNQANTSWEAKSASALENLLARELHQSFNNDIVRHASMALKDGGEGTIKIALKPESLGNVKIALELSDNKITGRVFVESEEALNAFRKEIASLEQAFKDGGFSAADLNLSLASEGNNAGMWDENQNVPHMIASRYQDNSERMESASEVNLVNVFIGQRKSSINLLV